MSNLRRILRVIEPHPGEHFKDKIIAVSLAFIVWFAVNAEPTIPQIYQGVPVTVVNVPPDLALAEEVRDTLTIRVSGTSDDLQSVVPGLLSPEIDLANANAGENFFRIDGATLNTPTGVSVVDIVPEEIRVTLEPREEKLVQVSPVTAGEPASGYEVVGRSTSPQAAEVSGPRSLIAAMERIETATVDVSGRRESFTRRVTLTPRNRLIEVAPQQRTVDMRIEIAEQAVTEQFDEIPVEVINSAFRTAVNPQQLSVVLSAPPSVLEQVDVERLRMVIDAEGLQPRNEDYLLEPRVQFGQEALSEQIEVISMYPQRRVNVRIFNGPSRQ